MSFKQSSLADLKWKNTFQGLVSLLVFIFLGFQPLKTLKKRFDKCELCTSDTFFNLRGPEALPLDRDAAVVKPHLEVSGVKPLTRICRDVED